MKYIKQLLAAGLLLSIGTVTADAALLSRGGGTMVYDTDLDITWVADVNLFKTQAAGDPDLVNSIIANISTVANYSGFQHALTVNDFNTENGRLTWWGA